MTNKIMINALSNFSKSINDISNILNSIYGKSSYYSDKVIIVNNKKRKKNKKTNHKRKNK